MGRRFKRTAFDLQNEIFHRHYRDIFALQPGSRATGRPCGKPSITDSYQPAHRCRPHGINREDH
jgi:hypothetical protein